MCAVLPATKQDTQKRVAYYAVCASLQCVKALREAHSTQLTDPPDKSRNREVLLAFLVLSDLTTEIKSSSKLFKAIIEGSENFHRPIPNDPAAQWGLSFTNRKVKLDFGAILTQIHNILAKCSKISQGKHLGAA